MITGILDRNVDSLGRNDIIRTRWQDIPGSGDGPRFLYNGIEIGMDARFFNGALVTGGLTLGRRVNDECWGEQPASSERR